MTSAKALQRLGVQALMLVGVIGLSGELLAQSTPPSDGAREAEASDSDTVSTVDRGKMRLTLLIGLVENELQEAKLKQSRLIAEASSLDQERRKLLDGPSDGTAAQQRRIEVIERQLQQIDQDMADVNARLPEINAELAELKTRLDEANGILRTPETETAVDDDRGGESAGEVRVDSASRWLDGKRQVQEALVYLGGYNALIDGDFGPRTQTAIRVYQRGRNDEQTGTLTEEQETALLQEAETLRARYGVTTIENRDQGYRVTYPSGLLSEDATLQSGGVRYASEDGRGELIVTSSSEGEPSGAEELTALYEDLLADYEVQYRRKRNDWFVVAGILDEGRIIYDTARLSGDRMIRARLSYPSEWRDLWSPFAVIMFNTFEPAQTGES